LHNVTDPLSGSASPEPSVGAWVVVVPEAAEDEASGLIWTHGCTGITIEKAPGDAVRLVCFFTEPEAHEGEMRAVAAAFEAEVSRVEVPNPDWVQRFKETFTSFDVPPFRIVPEWIDEAASAGDGPSSIRIRVDPGRAFGTGTHESTKLCLQSLGGVATTLKSSPRTLDLGCGTGILGIAASKLTNARVIACDYDPLATASARRHAGLNRVSLDVLLMDGCRGLRPGQFDLVCANLMAPFLISRAAEITAMGAPRCRFILAGLLRDEELAVRAAWPGDWRVASSYQGEWASLLYEQP
jgi:ribosomal protein L11 methyltransferase